MDAVVPTEKIGHAPDHFETIVLWGVVRSGHHEACLFQPGTSVVVLVGADHANVDDISSLLSQPLRQGSKDLRTGNPHVATHDCGVRLQKGRKGAAYGVGHIFVELFRKDTTDVVGFENGGIYLHLPAVLGFT